MTSTFAARTRYLSCSALFTLSVGCSGRRFESEANPLSTTSETQGLSSAWSPTQTDAAPTSPDTNPLSAETETTPRLADSGVETQDGADSREEQTTVTSGLEPDSGAVNATGDATTSSPSNHNDERGTSDTVTQSVTTDGTHASTEMSETAANGSTNIADSSGTPETADISNTTDPSEPPEMSDNPEAQCNQDERSYAGSCYFFGEGKKNWDGARQACRARGQDWDLAAINSFDEHEWVTAHLDKDAWLGASKTMGKWAWRNSETVFWDGNYDGYAVDDAFTWWEYTEPDDDGSGGQCLRYTDDSGEWAWADMPCSREYQYVCEAAP